MSYYLSYIFPRQPEYSTLPIYQTNISILEQPEQSEELRYFHEYLNPYNTENSDLDIEKNIINNQILNLLENSSDTSNDNYYDSTNVELTESIPLLNIQPHHQTPLSNNQQRNQTPLLNIQPFHHNENDLFNVSQYINNNHNIKQQRNQYNDNLDESIQLYNPLINNDINYDNDIHDDIDNYNDQELLNKFKSLNIK
jgi:hypothetical protein